jgi:hypothetical protein
VAGCWVPREHSMEAVEGGSGGRVGTTGVLRSYRTDVGRPKVVRLIALALERLGSGDSS